MKTNHHKERLNSIKFRYVFLPTECDNCNKELSRQKMYSVKRWGVNQKWFTYYYCQNCMHSKEEVLHSIDTDTGFGIAFVDRFPNYPEKDYTQLMR